MSTATPQTALTIRNILFATDFSHSSQRALLHAVTAARHFGAILHLAHVVQPALFSLIPPEGYAGNVEAEHIVIKLARSDAQKMVADILRKTECQLTHRTWIELGGVGETLCAIVRREHIDLAVVGTHGRTGISKFVMGSVAEEVFRHASCPVLTVGPHSWCSDPRSVRLKHILFPTDFSPDSLRALPIALSIAHDFRASVALLHVLDPALPKPPSDRAVQQHLCEMAYLGGPLPPELSLSFLSKSGNVAATVLETADHIGIDLIAFGLKAPDTYRDRLPWKHAYKIVCEAGCPVLSLTGTHTGS